MPYKNKEDLYRAQEAHRQKNFNNVWELLCRSSCADCSEDDPIVLQFDHLPQYEKSFGIADAVSGSTRSWKLIQSEIDKCEIVCANCHIRRTAARGGFKRHLAPVMARPSKPVVHNGSCRFESC